MSRLTQILEIKNNFEHTLNTTEPEAFVATKGILSDFGGFINKNKGMLYGLLGASLLNFAITSMQPVIAAQAPAEMSQSYNSDYSQIDFAKQVAEFSKNVNTGNAVFNATTATQDHRLEINDETINMISNLKEGESIMVVNPFWKNGTIEIKNTTGEKFGLFGDHSGSRLAIGEHGAEHQIDHDNAHMRVDGTTYLMNIDTNELNKYLDNFVGTQDPVLRNDLTRFMLYHEAGHATPRQSVELDKVAAEKLDTVDGELHSDVAALTLIGTETGSLTRFNNVINEVIKTRAVTSTYGSTHTTTYGLVELKKAMNDNQELMNMKQANISEFAYLVTQKMSGVNFDGDKEVVELRDGLGSSKEDILASIMAGDHDDAINYYGGKVLDKGTNNFEINKYKESNPERRLGSLANLISRDLKGHATHDDIAAISMINAQKTIKNDANSDGSSMDIINETVRSLTERADKNPILNHNTIAVVKAKIKIDELQYDYSKIIEIAKEFKENQNSDVVMKIGLKSNKIS